MALNRINGTNMSNRGNPPKVRHDAVNQRVEFQCPGCGWTHILNLDDSGSPCWVFNGDAASPTLTPSVRAQRIWGPKSETQCCHFLLRNGHIQFLSDCTHKLKGQTVELPPIDLEN